MLLLLLHPKSPTSLLFFLFPLSFLSSAFSLSLAHFLLFFSLVLPLLLCSFAFAILIFLALVFTVFHIHLNTLSSLLL